MKEAPVPPKRLFLQESHGVTIQKTPFFKYIQDYDIGSAYANKGHAVDSWLR
jgi:hypothetical protein